MSELMVDELVSSESEAETQETPFKQLMITATDQQQQIESLLLLSTKQQASIQQLIDVVEQLISNAPSSIKENPFEWLPHSQYTTAYPRLVSALTSGEPKQKTLTTLLGINPGGSVDWTKASRDWDRLKIILNS